MGKHVFEARSKMLKFFENQPTETFGLFKGQFSTSNLTTQYTLQYHMGYR